MERHESIGAENVRPRRTRAEAARDRALFVNFYRRELTTRYLGSVSGLLWALLNPLALLAVYHFVFTTVFRATGFAGQSFLAFVAVALWPWLAAQEALHFAGYLAVLVVLRIAGEPIRFEGLIVAVSLWVLLAIAITGLALLLSALQVFIRDVEHVLMPVMLILMYLTPILYPLSLVPANLRSYVAANPFSWLVDRLREGLLDGRMSFGWTDAVALLVALALFAVGRAMFLRLAPHFEDFV